MSEFGDIEQTMVPGTLRGYREWVPTPNGLQAVNFPFIWEPGVNTAQCARRDGPAPRAKCTCGFYARHTPFSPSFYTAIAGVIKASGRVILGTAGFRAQYAEIEALYFPPGWGTPTMLDQYNVPIYRDFDAMVQDFPPISVQHLLPEPGPTSIRFDVLSGQIAYSAEQVQRLIAAFQALPPLPQLPDIEEE